MVKYTWYPWVRMYVCDACAAPAFDCRLHRVNGITPWRFMTQQTHLKMHHFKHHRARVVAPAPRPDDVNAGYLAANDAEPPPHPLALQPPAVPPPLTRWLLANFEGTPTTHNFLADCTTLDCHCAVKVIMAKTLYGMVDILPAAVTQIM
jgi:hypothetical protein